MNICRFLVSVFTGVCISSLQTAAVADTTVVGMTRTIQGVVVNESNVPLAGAQVSVWYRTAITPTPALLQTASVASDGSFRFLLTSDPVAIADYTDYAVKVSPSSGGYSKPDQYWSFSGSTLVPPTTGIPPFGSDITTIRFVVVSTPLSIAPDVTVRYGAIIGSIYGVPSGSLSGFTIQAISTADTSRALDSAVSDATGKFMLYRVDVSGSFYLRAIPPVSLGLPPQTISYDSSGVKRPVPYAISAYATLQTDFNFSTGTDTTGNQQEKSPFIFGVVKDPFGKPVRGAVVSVFDSTSWWPDESKIIEDRYLTSSHSTRTDSLGQYGVTGLHTGTVRIMVRCDSLNFLTQFYPVAYTPGAAAQLVLTPQDSVGKTVNFVLKGGVQVIGTVKDTAGQPVAGLRFSLYPETGTSARLAKSAFSSATGRFTISGVPDGTWYTEMWDDSGYFSLVNDMHPRITTSLTTPTLYLSDTLFRVAAGAVMTGSLSIPGLVDTAYNSWNRGQIFIYPSTVSSQNYKNEYLRTTTIDKRDSASYRAGRIPAGNWKLLMCPPYQWKYNASTMKQILPSAPVAGARWSFVDGAVSFSAAKTSTFASKTTTVRSLAFLPGGYAVPGMFSDDSGKTWGGSSGGWARVTAMIKVDSQFIAVSTSEMIDGGGFVIPGLVPGESYYLRLEGESFSGQFWNPDGSTPTCNGADAKPWSFTVAAYKPLVVKAVHNPLGQSDGYSDSTRLPAVSHWSSTPVGFSGVKTSWARLAKTTGVRSYYLYRLPESALHFFTDNGSGFWDPGKSDSLDQLLVTFSAADTFFVDTTAVFGQTYLYVPAGVDSLGRDGQVELSVDKPIASYAFAYTAALFSGTRSVSAGTWDMISPIGVDTIRFDTSATASAHLFRWDEAADSTALLSHYTASLSIAPSQSGWLYADAAWQKSVDANAVKAVAARKGSVSISLVAGWNQVGSPFPYPVSPSWLSSGSFTAWEWSTDSGAYHSVAAFTPMRGCWIHADRDTVLPLSYKPSLAAPARAATAGLVWSCPVVLLGKNLCDADNEIGCIAGTARASMQTLKPPPGFGSAEIALTNERGERLSRLYRSAESDRVVFPVTISASGIPCALTPGTTDLPAGLSLFYVDRSGVQPFNPGDTVRFDASPVVRTGSIIATTRPGVAALFGGAPRLAGRSTAGHLGAQIVVPYAAGMQSDAARHVRIELLNLKGQRVSVLLDEMRVPGVHVLEWPAMPMAAGLYIMQLQVDGSAVRVTVPLVR